MRWAVTVPLIVAAAGSAAAGAGSPDWSEWSALPETEECIQYRYRTGTFEYENQKHKISFELLNRCDTELNVKYSIGRGDDPSTPCVSGSRTLKAAEQYDGGGGLYCIARGLGPITAKTEGTGTSGEATTPLSRSSVMVQQALGELAVCASDNPRTPCNVFVCKALGLAYGAEVAEDLMENGQCMAADRMASTLAAIDDHTRAAHSDWTRLGMASDPRVLERAQACANLGFPTIAVSQEPRRPAGHPAGDGRATVIVEGGS